jgi:hypothetical protein
MSAAAAAATAAISFTVLHYIVKADHRRRRRRNKGPFFFFFSGHHHNMYRASLKRRGILSCFVTWPRKGDLLFLSPQNTHTPSVTHTFLQASEREKMITLRVFFFLFPPYDNIDTYGEERL